MFFDIGWPELMLIGVVALVVIGPKDLPAALRVAGYWVRKARTMSREFQSSVEQMLREAELHEVRQELRKVTEINLDHEVNKIIDPTVAGAAQTVPRPAEIPDYFDHTPAPADPMAPPGIAHAEATAAEDAAVSAEDVAQAAPGPLDPEPAPPPLPDTPAAEPAAPAAAEPPKP